MTAVLDDRRAPAPRAVVAVERRVPALAGHAFALALVLLAGFAVLRPAWPTLSDEGAALAQVDALAGGRGWLVEHPLPTVDPDGRAFPIDLSWRADDGRFAPLAKHPLFALLLTGPYLVAGPIGAFAVPLAGTFASAVVAALLARRLRLGDERVVLWVVGGASPLLFDAYLLIAHSVGAALAGAAVLLVLRRRPGAFVAGLAVLAVAQLLRNEAVLFGLALGLALIGSGLRARGERRSGAGRPLRHRLDAALGLAVLSTTLAAYRLDALLAGLILGPDATSVFRIGPEGSFLSERATGAFNALLRPPDLEPLTRLVVLGVFVALVLGARAAVTGGGARRATTALLGAAGLALVAYALAPALLVPGFAIAAPVVVCGFLGIDRRELTGTAGGDSRSADVAVVGATLALFVLAVLATQYPDAGNSWGGRFLTLGIPLAGPFAAAGLGRVLAGVPGEDRRAAGGAVVLVAAVLGGMAMGSVRSDQRATAAIDELVGSVTASLPAGDADERPVVLATERGFGRLLWSQVRDQRWLYTPDDTIARFGPRLQEAGIRRFLVLTHDPDGAAEALAPWFEPVGPPQRTTVTMPGSGDVTLAPAAVVFHTR